MNELIYDKDLINIILSYLDPLSKNHLLYIFYGILPEKDEEMFQRMIEDSDLQADQWKIYPTNVLEFTEIKNWYKSGIYKPYSETNFPEFIRILVNTFKNIPPWIRVNRIQRDFPCIYIDGGNKVANLREVLDKELNNFQCKEIRSMEVRENNQNMYRARLVRCDYRAQNGTEIFLSFKSCNCHLNNKYKLCISYEKYKLKCFIYNLFGLQKPYFYGCGNEDTIYGFLRMRLSKNAGLKTFPLLQNKALIRELHIYGSLIPVFVKNNSSIHTQHYGFGKALLQNAEYIARIHNNINGMAVISGVGVRQYYRKFGFEIHDSDFSNHGNIMIKNF